MPFSGSQALSLSVRPEGRLDEPSELSWLTYSKRQPYGGVVGVTVAGRSCDLLPVFCQNFCGESGVPPCHDHLVGTCPPILLVLESLAHVSQCYTIYERHQFLGKT